MKNYLYNSQLTEEYNENKSVRISTELLRNSYVSCPLNSVYSVKLLYAIAQSIQNIDIAPEKITFSVTAIYKYLNLEKQKNSYSYLKSALDEIMKNPIEIMEQIGKKRKFISISWITKYEFIDPDGYLELKLNSDSISFIHNLTQYTAITPKNYMQLNTVYSTWLYPYFMNFLKIKEIKVSLNELKHFLLGYKNDKYTGSRATSNFFERVLGIKPSAKYKEYLKSNKKTNFVSWDYVTVHIGTLQKINETTDIFVEAMPIKTGRTYTHIKFLIQSKKNKNILPPKNKIEITEEEFLLKFAYIKELFPSMSIEELIKKYAHTSYEFDSENKKIYKV